MLRENYAKNDVGLSLCIALIAVIVVSVIASVPMLIFGDKLWVNIAATAVNSLAIGSAAFIHAKLTHANVVKATKMNVAPPVGHIAWGVLGTAFLITMMVPLNGWITKGIEAIGLPTPNVNLELDIYSMIICAAILPAFTEEIVFRGTIANALERNGNKLGSLALAGAIFSLFHMNPAQTVHQFVLGAFLALLIYRSGSLWTTVIVHFFNNFSVIMLSLIFGEKIDVFFEKNAIWLFFVGLVGFAGCVVGYLFTTKSKWVVNKEKIPYTKGNVILLSASMAVCFAMWLMTLFVGSGA